MLCCGGLAVADVTLMLIWMTIYNDVSGIFGRTVWAGPRTAKVLGNSMQYESNCSFGMSVLMDNLRQLCSSYLA